uniref:Carboxy-terminal domain RNA polymerase II polypeptide A small phosphatase 1 n=1 Tax=Lygus hesperus TaxID=30085 RepID=A0A0A9YI85_LYGHE
MHAVIDNAAGAKTTATGNTNCLSAKAMQPASFVTETPKAPHTTVKDIQLLGRELNSVVIIENTPDCVVGYENNAILVSDYDGGELADDTLHELVKLLDDFVMRKKELATQLPTVNDENK